MCGYIYLLHKYLESILQSNQTCFLYRKDYTKKIPTRFWLLFYVEGVSLHRHSMSDIRLKRNFVPG